MSEEDNSEQGRRFESAMLQALGPHFNEAVTEHIERHESGHEEGERKLRLVELADRLKPLERDESGVEPERRRSRTGLVAVETLDSGTQVYAYLNATSIVPGQPGNLNKTVKELTAKDGKLGAQYLEDGPATGHLREVLEIPTGSFSIVPDSRLREMTRAGLAVVASLKTAYGEGEKDREYGVGTNNDVLVGIIIDPESIVVPEPSEGSDEPLYRLIGRGSLGGPDDIRFDAIMAMADHVLAADGHTRLSE